MPGGGGVELRNIVQISILRAYVKATLVYKVVYFNTDHLY